MKKAFSIMTKVVFVLFMISLIIVIFKNHNKEDLKSDRNIFVSKIENVVVLDKGSVLVEGEANYFIKIKDSDRCNDTTSIKYGISKQRYDSQNIGDTISVDSLLFTSVKDSEDSFLRKNYLHVIGILILILVAYLVIKYKFKG